MTLAPGPRENAVQRAVVALIETVVPGAFVFAIPNAARRNRGGKAGNAVPGLKAGMPDLGFMCPQFPGVTFYPEVKRPGGKLSQAQRVCHAALRQCGAPVTVVEGIDEMRIALAAWGIKTREVAA